MSKMTNSYKKEKRRKKICIACGGSAGHIFPGLTLAEELVKCYGDSTEILFLTSDNKISGTLLKESGFDFYTLPLRGIKRGTVRENLDFMLNLLKGSLRSMEIIFSNWPDCFVGFGSYIAGPPFIAASLLRVPTLIHEQNARMGKANRFMRHFATKVALSFPESAALQTKNIVITGNPIRESASRIRDKTSARDFLGMSQDKFTILVIGGSQGAQKINSIAVDMFRDMERKLRDGIQVIHLSGERDYEKLKREYKDIAITHGLYSFFKEMGIIYSAADIAISRAGASVIFELCAHRIPSILIPYPFAESHQVQNAKFLAEQKAAIIIEEDGLSKESLQSSVTRLMDGDSLRKSMGEIMETLASPDAAKRLTEEVGLLTGLRAE